MNTIDQFYKDAIDVAASLPADQPSLLNTVNNNLRKALLLAATSHFEHILSNAVSDAYQQQIGSANHLISFVRNKAISRQYHTWFNWKERNANQFFGLFGDDFKEWMQNNIRNSPELASAIVDFLDLGNERNKLIHQDFASFPFEKTIEEVYKQYTSASAFVFSFSTNLRDYLSTRA